ncbi:MAG: glycosyltransferase family 2 protein [Lachnospiraceae bacterium]
MKKISIIIPCYNVEAYVNQCMDSLVNQTMDVRDLEIIAVDDASTDHTLEHLLDYENKYPQSVMVIHCEENGKQGTARNIGLSYASAPYIMFVDSDDWIEPDACRKMYAKATRYDCDAVAANYIEEYSRESTDVTGKKGQDQYYIIETDEERGGFLGVDFGIGFAGNLYRRSMLIENDIFFPEGYSFEDDYWYVLSMHYIKKAYIVGETFYHYFQNESSTIHKMDLQKQLDRAVVEQLKLQTLIDRGIYQRYPELYEHEFLQRYYMQMEHILLTGFEPVPYDVVHTIHEEAYGLFPDYRRNQFVKRILAGAGGSFMTVMYDMLDKQWDDSVIEELKKLDIQDNGSWIDVRI